MRILLAEDDRPTRVTLADDLKDAGHDVTAVADGPGAKSALQGESFDCAILDIRIPGANGVDLMKEIRAQTPETEVILITGHGTMESVLDALRAGAYNYLLKPFDNEEVVLALRRLEELRILRSENMALKKKLGHVESFRKLVGKTPGMLRVYDMIRTIAPTDVNVLITGESGTGKELAADAIHAQSERSNGPFIKFSCAALPESLIETELFGHEKGAFTGADRRKSGRFQMASGGSIFLDDVDDVPLGVQTKLLRCLEEKKIWPVGGNPFDIDIRIMAATKVDLAVAVEEKQFREDLYYRLNVIRLDLPPLRHRTDDIPLLVEHFVRLHGAGRKYITDRDTMEAMARYPWPGNVRELENAVERAIALAGGTGTETVTNLSRDHLLPAGGIRPERVSGTLAEAVGEAERNRIAEALKVTGGKRSEAACILGISRKTLWEKAKKFGIK